MIANLGPADWNFDETMSTLRYANRAKNIKNKPKINEDPKDSLLREFEEEAAKLRAQLQGAGSASGHKASLRREGEQLREEDIAQLRTEIEAELKQSKAEEQGSALSDAQVKQARSCLNSWIGSMRSDSYEPDASEGARCLQSVPQEHDVCSQSSTTCLSSHMNWIYAAHCPGCHQP